MVLKLQPKSMSMRAKTFLMLALILSVIACGESDPQSQAKQAAERSSDPAIGDEERGDGPC